jgi:RNA polymerase sigma-70 factor (ECF subfamily)
MFEPKGCLVSANPSVPGAAVTSTLPVRSPQPSATGVVSTRAEQARPGSAANAETSGAHVRALPAQVGPTFAEVYATYFEFVWRTAANRGIPRAALDDVAQEVFIVVDRKLHEFEGRSSLRTWIAAIVRRVVADYVRKRGNRPAGDETLEREPASAAVSGEPLEQSAALELLDGLLAKMTDDQREVFVLHEIEELSGVEIAEVTGANENTVWTRLRAARRIFSDGVARQRARREREEA